MTTPPAQHSSTDLARLRRRRTVVLALFALLATVAILATIVVGKLNSNLTVVQLEPDEDIGPGAAAGAQVQTDPLNILVLGSDGRDAGDGAYGEDDGTRRSDSMMLVHVAEGNERIEAVQIPRDTVLDLPACTDRGFGAFSGGRGMINAAFNFGEGCSVEAVEALTGVDVDHVVSMNFDGFATVVDAVGGIEVCLEEPISDGHSLLDLPAGQQELGGEDALALARVRYVIGDGSDISRLENQQMVMSAIVQRATDREVLSSPTRLYALVDAITSSLTVDAGLSSVTKLAGLALRVNDAPDERITFVTMPWQPAAGDPNRVEASPDADIVWSALAADEPIVFAEPEEPADDPADAPAPDETTAPAPAPAEEPTTVDATTRTAADPVCG
ncbi:LCP family protein [Microbacterium sp. G2-8]|uniref:LCP family protein n=1 Tax=Microbacterium sp. G2-8 TaxID=2842454 RepID=UPI001C8A6672|nr:LCP family protein [Microbacterium sp. G2-8]